jgi:Rrf2 family protein
VKSVRGPQGGYSLSTDADKITCGMVLRVMEGSLLPVPCMEEGSDACERVDDCLTLPLWKRLAKAIESVVDGTTLQDLLDHGEPPQIGMWL